MARTIEARVIQKIDTEQGWNANELILYKGEIALVGDPDRVYNIKVGNGVKKFRDLPYMVDYVNGLYTKEIYPNSSVPSGLNNVFLVSEEGTYTNFGNVTLPKDNLGIIYKNGNNYTIQLIPIVSEEKLQKYIDEKLVDINVGFGGEITDLNQSPNVQGMYIPKVNGVYPNFGNLEYNSTEGFTLFLYKDGQFSKITIPLSGVENEVEFNNNVLGVSGSAVEKYAVKKINTIADLRNTVGEYEGQIISLLGYYYPGDKEPLNYKWTLTQGVDDGGSVINAENGSWKALFNDVSILDFGIVNDNTIDQSTRLDNHAKYCDENDIYEIDYLNFDILTSKTVTFISTRNSHHSGITFREAHKIKNLRISHDLTSKIKQGNKLIQFIPKYNPTSERIFALENIIFNPYNPNYEILSGEADGYMLGFGAFVEPDTWVRPSGVQEQSNWSFDFRNIVFETPAVSYNMATADILAKNIYCENMSGQHWGLYYFFIGKDNNFKNCKSFFRDDLHAGSGRILVTSLLHIETEIGDNGVINVNTLNIDNCECLYYTNNALELTFKHHNIGEHIFENVNVSNSSGIIEFYAGDINKTTVKNINIYNHGRGGVSIDVKLYNLYANKGWFEPRQTIIRGGRNEEIQNFIIENCKINGSWSYFGGGINEINNMIIKDCTVVEPDIVYGIFRTSNVRIRNLKFINHISRGTRLFEASVNNLYIDGMKSETNVLDNFIILRNTPFAPECNLYINNLKLANVTQAQYSSFIATDSGYVVNPKQLTNSFTKDRLDYNFEFEANVYPIMRGTTAERPLLNNSIGKMYYNTSINTYEVYNGTNWVKFISDATTLDSGVVKKSATVADVSSANATDLATALTLVNELKAKLNAKLTADRNSGQQAIQ